MTAADNTALTNTAATNTAYDENNPFALILQGKIPAYKIYEDDHSFAFMDIMPRTDGHCLVIPKKPSRNLLDADPATLAQIIAVVQKIAIAAKRAFDADGVAIDQFNEKAAGQTVFHLHFHIMPRHEGIAPRPHTGQMADKDILEKHAEMLRRELQTS